MPESRLARTRRTLPAGYQFPVGRYIDPAVTAWWDAHDKSVMAAFSVQATELTRTYDEDFGEPSASDRLDGYRAGFAHRLLKGTD